GRGRGLGHRELAADLVVGNDVGKRAAGVDPDAQPPVHPGRVGRLRHQRLLRARRPSTAPITIPASATAPPASSPALARSPVRNPAPAPTGSSAGPRSPRNPMPRRASAIVDRWPCAAAGSAASAAAAGTALPTSADPAVAPLTAAS